MEDRIPQSNSNLSQKIKEFNEFYSSQKMELKLGIDIQTLEETKKKLTSEIDFLHRLKSQEIGFLYKEKLDLSEEIESVYKEKLDLERDVKLLKKQQEKLGRSKINLLSQKVEKAILKKKKLKIGNISSYS